MDRQGRFKLVQGAKKAAIYDLESGKVYAVNASGKQILLRLLAGCEDFREEEQAYLEQLEQLGISASTLEEDGGRGAYEAEDEPGLDYVWLELTERCNCNCVHCYGQWGDAARNLHPGPDRDSWFRILDEIHRRGGREIQLIGGEPLLYPDFASVLRHAHQLGMDRIDVFTNATMIDDRTALLLRECGANVRVSLYGHTAEIHEKVTQRSGSFSKTERGLKLLKQYGIPVNIAVVVMDLNEEHLPDIRRYIEGLGFEYDGYDTIRQAVGVNQISHCVSSPDLLSARYQTAGPDCSHSG
jgi:sulfatase maturation enzyme AslB (radical SAM superfamily)